MTQHCPPHYCDNQGLCHYCGLMMDEYLWRLYTKGPDVVTATKLIAHFTPQAWQKDYAIDVDAEGEQYWNCTSYCEAEGLVDDILDEIAEDGYWLDTDDVLICDPDAPEWVRNWHGPFSITVRRAEDTANT